MSTTSNLEAIDVRTIPQPRMPLFWRIFSYLFMFVLVNLLANLSRVGLTALGAPPLMSRLAFVLVYIAGVLSLTFMYRRVIDRKQWAGIALTPLHVSFPLLAGGFGLGILATGLVFTFELGAQWIRIVGYASGTNALTLLIDSLLLSAAFGVTEEICMRGYLFLNLSEARPVWQATLITGIIFGAFHLLSLGFGVRGASFFIFALMLNAFLVLTRLAANSLWVAIGFHTAFDWAVINLGLGSVVIADQHLLQVQRTIGLPVEDLLATLVVGLGFVLLSLWTRRRAGVQNESAMKESA